MSARDKKYDDLQEKDTPATWWAKHVHGYKSPQQLRTSAGAYRSIERREWSQEKRTKEGSRDDDYDQFMKCCDFEDENSCPAMTARLPQSKPLRRLVLLLVGVLALGYFSWSQAIAPLSAADWPIREGFLRMYRGSYGFAEGGDYDIVSNRITTLDERLLPGGASDVDGKRRLVFVGDIHGCKDELHALLKACAFNEEFDHLIATGDIISKGPDSPGVIDEMIRLKATSVRGNHEDRILTLRNSQADESINQAKEVTAASSKDNKLLKSLHHRHIEYIRHTPLILRIPQLPLANSLAAALKHDRITSQMLVVHGGLVPAVPLRKQDPFYVMNMRSLGRKTHVPSSQPASKSAQTVPWIDLWAWYQERLQKRDWLQGWHNIDSLLDEREPERPSLVARMLAVLNIGRKRPPLQVVIYGHDSREGLKIKQWTRGLDSGCVRGEKLTALVLDAYGTTELVSVKCKHHTSL